MAELDEKLINYEGLNHFYDNLKDEIVEKSYGTLYFNLTNQTANFSAADTLTDTGMYPMILKESTSNVTLGEVLLMVVSSNTHIQQTFYINSGTSDVVLRVKENNIWSWIVAPFSGNTVKLGLIEDNSNLMGNQNSTYSKIVLEPVVDLTKGVKYKSNGALEFNGNIYNPQTCTVVDFGANYVQLTSLGEARFAVDDRIAATDGGACTKILDVNGFVLTIENPLDFTVGEIVYSVDGDNQATGQQSVAEGLITKATGIGSHAEGYKTTANGNFSHAEGFKNTTNYDYCHAEGYENTTSGRYSHVEGRNNTINGNNYAAHAEGRNNIMNGNNYGAHIEGSDNVINANYSHVEGYLNELYSPTGGVSHIEGWNNKFTQSDAEAVGNLIYCHVEGCCNKPTSVLGLHMQGVGGVPHRSTSASDKVMSNANSTLVVGGGDAGNTIHKNAFEVMQGGDVYMVGVGNYVGTDTKNQDATVQPVQDIINDLIARVVCLESKVNALENQ